MSDEAVTAVTFIAVLSAISFLCGVAYAAYWLIRGLNALIRRLAGVDVIEWIKGAAHGKK